MVSIRFGSLPRLYENLVKGAMHYRAAGASMMDDGTHEATRTNPTHLTLAHAYVDAAVSDPDFLKVFLPASDRFIQGMTPIRLSKTKRPGESDKLDVFRIPHEGRQGPVSGLFDVFDPVRDQATEAQASATRGRKTAKPQSQKVGFPAMSPQASAAWGFVTLVEKRAQELWGAHPAYRSLFKLRRFFSEGSLFKHLMARFSTTLRTAIDAKQVS